MSFTKLSSKEKQILLDIARQSIHYGLEHQKSLPVEIEQYPYLLQQKGASFVTLHINHQLRGCIGTLEAYQPLVKDVADHAFAAAFHDNRFPPLTAQEASELDIHISILTAATPIDFSSESDLIKQLQPGIDGLILETEYKKGTFLPSVWESLPEPKDFLNHLKIKAGLPGHYWNDDIKVSRYHTISIS
ncbi:MAG: AmmeMemoRadiSam system protein A [Gammaproteobacteria bacterium]|nr:AmmeMemoRadiSam system protein A [Gammaproteobacteria bacterium]